MGRSNESSRGAKHNHYHSNTETSLKHEVRCTFFYSFLLGFHVLVSWIRAQSPCSQVDQLETRLEDQFKVRCAL